MIKLNEEGIIDLRKRGMESANTLETFVSNINVQLFKGKNCTIWAEDESVVAVYKKLSEYMIYHKKRLVTFGEMLCHLLDNFSAMSGIENIIVKTDLHTSDNCIYSKCGVWIMTANYFFTNLYILFKVKGIPPIVLETFAKEIGFSFEIQEVDNDEHVTV